MPSKIVWPESLVKALVAQYDSGRSLNTLGRQQGVANITIGRLFKSRGVHIRTPEETFVLNRKLLGARPIPPNAKRVFEILYCRLDMSIDEISGCYAASWETVKTLLQEAGVEIIYAFVATSEMVKAYNDGEIVKDIAFRTGYAPETMRLGLIRAGVQMRGRGSGRASR